MKFLKILFLFIMAIFFHPAFSSAHAYIIKSLPAENQIFQHPPKTVSIEFNEEIQPSFHDLRVFDQNGSRVDNGNQHILKQNHKLLEADLKSNLPPGIYSLKWKAVSSDGHPVDGVVPFQIGDNSSKLQSAKSGTRGYVPGLDLIIIRWLQYLGSAIFVGLLFYSLCVLPKGSLQSAQIAERYKKISDLGFILLCFGTIAAFPMQAVIESGQSWATVWTPAIFKELLTNTLFGAVWILQVIILFWLMNLSKLRSHRVYKWFYFALAASVLAAKAVTSHAYAAANKYIAIFADFLHLLSASVWIGSLIAMVILLPLRKSEEGRLFFRGIIHLFFQWGVLAVLTLTATGIYGSFLSIPTLGSLLNTIYGRVLLGKVILFFVMLLFAWVNFSKGRRDVQKGWGTSLRVELGAGLSVLVLAVILTNLPTAMSSPGPVQESKTLKNKQSVSLSIGPNVIGNNTFKILLNDQNGRPQSNIEQVSLTFTFLEKNLEENTINIPETAEGRYETKGMYLNRAGRWKIHVHVLTKSLEDLDADFSIITGSQ